MKKILMILLMLSYLTAKCQLGWEDFYSEKDFRVILQQARTPVERIYALGLLGRKGLSKDSITREIYTVADKTNDKVLKASASWWDAQLHEDDTTKMIKLFQFSEQAQLIPYQIAADLLLADYYIHHNIDQSLFYAKGADSLLEKLQGPVKERDSLKIEAYRRIAHAYIHRGDAINTAKYLLSLRSYAERDKDEHIKMQAVEVLDDMYSESDDKKKGLPWIIMLHEYFRKTNQLQKYTGQTYDLAVIYSQLYLSDFTPEYKMKAIYYFKVLDKLIDSLNAHGWFLYWVLQNKFDIGLLSGKEVIKLLDNNYNSHHLFTRPQSRNLKLQIYLSTNQFDSLEAYIAKIPESEFKSLWLKNYYLKKEDFVKAIPLLKEFQDSAEKHQDLGALQWVYPDLIKAYVGKKDYEMAYKYQLKSLQVKDTLDKLASKEQVASMETQKQIDLQQAAFDDEQTKISYRNRIRLYAFGAGLMALLVVAVILWTNNQRKQKDKLKIEQSYHELKATQAQLIQSEKMASLGELTAGIAHEIQNPLNFVNNFSDVNTELVDELKTELTTGNQQQAMEIADSIKDNEQKINHHGKRADAIVKGMLQHSRMSSGQKEPTDINALCDEYLRLAYYGLRAKDKSFNVKTETDFDPNIRKIDVVPQDIGRVILNLINNAFYAVNEKTKQNIQGYEPTVTVSSKKVNSKVELKVIDNGNGIPQKVLDKIFQPFFTTKPSGQGTGLGLSLSYDIVKAHGGELKVENKEGAGATFIIEIPIAQ